MTWFCKYSHALGIPNKGIHALRVRGFAAIDILLTGGLAALITKCTFYKFSLSSYLFVLILLIMTAIYVHEFFCVRTYLNAWIFNRPWPDPGDV